MKPPFLALLITPPTDFNPVTHSDMKQNKQSYTPLRGAVIDICTLVAHHHEFQTQQVCTHHLNFITSTFNISIEFFR